MENDFISEQNINSRTKSLRNIPSSKYGYLPKEALKVVSEKTGKPMVDIYGVATFYKLFSLKPKGKHVVSVCLGTACQVRADGNGITFSGVGETVQAIDAILVPLGWTLVNGADGPTGSGSVYTLGDLVALVFVKWVPAPDADCPKDQPISACPLTPGQMLYTVTVTFGQK